MDLRKMTRKELEKLRDRVDKQLEKLAATDRKAALAEAEKVARAHGFSLKELTGADAAPKTRRKSGGAKSKSVPKYANPADSSQTWTGKGRQPGWFKDAIAAGKSPDSMAI